MVETTADGSRKEEHKKVGLEQKHEKKKGAREEERGENNVNILCWCVYRMGF